jgi:hypothetical protein
VRPLDHIASKLHLVPPGTEEQLRLPMHVDGEHTLLLRKATKQFGTQIAARLSTSMLMRAGSPLVAGSAPAVLMLLDPDGEHSFLTNLAVGCGLGGAWGAFVGAAIPQKSMEGVRIPRLQSGVVGLAKGLMLAPAMAAMAAWGAGILTKPIEQPGSKPATTP